MRSIIRRNAKANNRIPDESRYARRRAIVSVLLIFIIISISIISYISTSVRVEKNFTRILTESASSADSYLQILLDENLTTLNNAKQFFFDEQLKVLRVEEYIKNIRIGYMQFPVHLYFPDGSAFTEKGYVTSVISREEYNDVITQLNSNSFYVSKIKVHSDSSKFIIEQFIPVISDNRIIGLLSTIINLSDIEQYFSLSAFSKDSFLAIIDRRDNTVLLDTYHHTTSTTDSFFEKSMLSEDEVMDVRNAINNQKSIYLQIEIADNNSSHHIVLMPSKYNDYIIGVMTNDKVVFKEVIEIRWYFAILCVLIIVAYIIVMICLYNETKLHIKHEKESTEKHNRSQLQAIQDVISFGHWSVLFNEKNEAYSYDFSDEFMSLIGYDNFSQSFNLNSLIDLIHPEDRKRAIEAFMATLLDSSCRTPLDVKYRLKTSSDSPYSWFRSTGRIIRDENNCTEFLGTQFNITEEQNKEVYSDIFNSFLHDYSDIFTVQLDTLEIEVISENGSINPNIAEVTTWDKQLSVWKDLCLRIHPSDRDAILEILNIEKLKEKLRNERRINYIFRFQKYDKYKYVELVLVKLGEDFDLPKLILIGYGDISENQSTEFELRRITESLSDNCDCILHIDFETDTCTEITVTDEFRKLFNSSFNSSYREIVNYYCKNFVYADDVDLFSKYSSIEYIESKLKEHDSFSFTYRTFENGQIHWKEEYYTLDSQNCNHLCAYNTLFSINPGIQAKFESETKRKTEELQSVIYGLTDDFDAVILINAETETDKIIRLKDELRFIFPSSFESANYAERSKYIADNLVIPSLRDSFIQATSLKTIISHLQEESVYYHNYSSLFNGKTLHMQIKYVYADKQKKSILAGFHNADVETRNEIQLREALSVEKQRAEEANKAKTSFLFNMSHDIRTPMNAIIGFTNIALKNINNPETVKDCLLKSQNAENLLLNLVNDILEMSRIESGKIVLHEESVKLSEIFDEIIPLTKAFAAEKNINFKVNIDIRDNYVKADSVRLERLFINIITNAIKYTNPTGDVIVNFYEKETSYDSDNKALYEFKVTDNGIGMSKEFQKHVFDEFTREETVTSSGIQGTGLGLALCKSLVTLMQGEISCESEIGKGSVFKVILPMEILPVSIVNSIDSNMEASTSEVLSGKRVLLAEDNELNREIAEFILSEQGLLVEEAEDGQIAFEMYSQKGPGYYDCILMDIQMPRLNGYEATAAIRKLHPEDHIPIIAVSANAFEEDKNNSIRYGMDAHIPKPIKSNELIDLLKHFLG